MPPKDSSSNIPTQLTAAIKKVRDALEKDKEPGWIDRVQAWAAGKKKLEALLLDPKFSYTVFHEYLIWADENLLSLVTTPSAPQFFSFFYTLLDHLYIRHVKPIVDDGSGTTPITKINETMEKEDTPTGMIVRVGKLTSHIMEDILQLYSDDHTGTHADKLHTKQWIQLVTDLLLVCMTTGMGEDILQSSLCELLFTIASDTDHNQGKAILQDPSVLGFGKLGSFLFRSEGENVPWYHGRVLFEAKPSHPSATGTSIWLLRIIAALLPRFTGGENLERTKAIQRIVTSQQWDKSIVKEAFAAIGRMTPTSKPFEIMNIVNILMKDTTHTRPKGFQVTSFTVDGVNQLTSNKSQRYLNQGQIIIYLDDWGLVCKAFDQQDSEQDMAFRIHRILQLVRSGGSGFDFTYQKETGDGHLRVHLSIVPEQAQEFYGLVVTKAVKDITPYKVLVGDSNIDINDALSNVPQIDDADVQAAIENLNSSCPNVLTQTIEDAFTSVAEERPRWKAATVAASHVSQQITSQVSVKDADSSVNTTGEEIESQADYVEVEREEERKDGEAGGDDEGQDLPPLSQQIAMKPVNATTRSAKKFGKSTASGTRPFIKSKTNMDNDSDVSEAETASYQKHPPNGTSKSSEPLLKTVLNKASASQRGGGFKVPTPRSSAVTATLHDQIQKGLSTTPATIRTAKATTTTSNATSQRKGGQDDKRTRKAENSPRTRSAASKASVPSGSPRKPQAKRRSQFQEELDNDEDEAPEEHAPLPWEVRDNQSLSKVTTRKQRLSDMKGKSVASKLTPPPAPPPSPPLPGSSPPQQDIPMNEEDTRPVLLDTVEKAVFAVHPSTRSYIDNAKRVTIDRPSQDLGTSNVDAAAQVGSSLANNFEALKPTSNAVDQSSSIRVQHAKTSGAGNGTDGASRAEQTTADEPIVNTKIGSARLKGKSAAVSKVPPDQAASSSRLERRQEQLSPASKDEDSPDESPESTTRPTITRKFVEALFEQLRQDEEEGEMRIKKKARIALLPSLSAEEEDIQPAKPQFPSKSRSIRDNGHEQRKGKTRKSDESTLSNSNEESKWVRRRSNSAEVKAVSEGERMELKVTSEVEQLMTKGAKRRLESPMKQVRLAGGQFSKLATKLIDHLHNESKNHLKGFHERCKATKEKYDAITKNEVGSVWDECKGINEEMDGLMRVDRERWGLKDVLFE
ncbi:uncharacterized protein L199_007481 [Kwoniella botswanensis]|uniref:uncharacterized protein n=1 Tax=Kwoniella botswanensis TaxID=1268659 RepID=UPI00315C9443